MGRIFTVVPDARVWTTRAEQRRARVEQLCVGVEQRWQGLRSVTFSTIGAGREYLHCGTQSKPEASAEACSPRRCRCRFVLMVAGKGLACGLSQAFPSLFASRCSSRRSLWRLCLSFSSGTCTGTGTGSAAPKPNMARSRTGSMKVSSATHRQRWGTRGPTLSWVSRCAPAACGEGVTLRSPCQRCSTPTHSCSTRARRCSARVVLTRARPVQL